MDNPNEYNDEQYARYSVEVNDAIAGLWEAGADLDNIQNDIENALENVAGARFFVTITER